MLFQILLGSIFICLCVIIHTFFIAAAMSFLDKKGNWLLQGNPLWRSSVALSGVTLWLMASITISVWIWAGLFLILGSFAKLEPALYFSIVSFTTLGFGDVVIESEWRLLSGFLAASGLIQFSLSTAFLIEFLIRMRKAQSVNQPKI